MPFLLLATCALVAPLYLIGFPAAFLLGAMGAAMFVAGRGATVRIPDWTFGLAQAVVGCLVARSFTPALFHTVLGHLALAVLGSMAVLIAGCAAIGWALTRVGHLDMLTAYFATSPGGADSIAIITAGTSVDVPLVMAIQVGRFVAVLLLGPALARRAAQLAGALQQPTGEST